jgi:hypothetical protein
MEIEHTIAIGLTILLTAGIGSCTISDKNKQDNLATMVKAGADPQKAACAVYFGVAEHTCIILATNGVK